jgi:selenide,water dikinase
MIERLPSKHVVLLGIGHTNAHVVRMWAMNPVADADLTCISDHGIATYSGMLPAVLSGLARERDMEIDLVRLCASVGARLITDPVAAIDHDKREVLFDGRPSIPFDVLSIGIGSVPATGGLETGVERIIKIKPMQSFLRRLRRAVSEAQRRAISEAQRRAVNESQVDNSNGQLTVVVVGAGVAGTEIAFCLPPFLKAAGAADHVIRLVTRSERVLPGVSSSTREKVLAGFRRRGVTVTTGRSVTRVEARTVTLDDGSTIEADLVIWATGAAAPELLNRLGLPLNDRGFIATDRTLRSTSGAPVFAVGDTGTMVGESLPKAGVYAVRQGPVLWENFARLLRGESLQEYVPQQSFLKLINQGDGTAIGQWKGFSFSGKWVMRLKDSIDSRFMEMFRPRPMLEVGDEPMQCRGCGCKLGGELLESALDFDHSAAKLEDAAEVGMDSDVPIVASTDFFSSPLDDAFLTGRVAALHSASDIVASGAMPTHALANVVLPEGDSEAQRRMLQDFMTGARVEFDAVSASIVGGHTIVGPRMEVGFTVIGRAVRDRLIRKGNLAVGDQLWLTKPIGIGILLAAHARSICRAGDFRSLIDAMLLRQHDIARIASECGITAGTDVTGFGLAGHLLEMLQSSRVSATIWLDRIPLLPGVEDYVGQGVESSLAPENRRAESRMAGAGPHHAATYAALFDPQTCGGLLLGVAPNQVDPLRRSFSHANLPECTQVGEVTAEDRDRPRLNVR